MSLRACSNMRFLFFPFCVELLSWILYQRSGKRWRPIGYYNSPEVLLKSFYRKLLRSEPPKSTLEQHIEHCLEVAQAAADRLLRCLATHPQSVLNTPPAPRRTIVKMEIVK